MPFAGTEPRCSLRAWSGQVCGRRNDRWHSIDRYMSIVVSVCRAALVRRHTNEAETGPYVIVAVGGTEKTVSLLSSSRLGQISPKLTCGESLYIRWKQLAGAFFLHELPNSSAFILANSRGVGQ